MANEITISVRAAFSAGRLTHTVSSSKVKADVQYDNILIDQVQNCGTGEEAIQLAELAGGGNGWCYLENLGADSTAPTIYVRAATGETNFLKLLPGEPALFRWDEDAAQAPYILASAAGGLLRVVIYGA